MQYVSRPVALRPVDVLYWAGIILFQGGSATTNQTRRAGRYLLAFLLPAGALLAVYALSGFAPFGETSLLTTDMAGQYVSFFSYFKEMAAQGNDFFYTFSKSLGGDMLGFAAYYLFSPFNLLLLPFSTASLPYGILLITLLKTGTAGLTACLFFDREARSPRGSLLFALGYALSTFFFAYQQNLIWFDGLIGLPVVLLGIHRLIQRRRPLLYALSLGLTMLCSYYIGYMICLFSVLYFTFSLVRRTPRMSGKACAGAAGRFLAASAAGVGLSAAVLLPTLLALVGGDKSLSSFSPLDWTERFNGADILAKLFTGSFTEADIWSSYLPMVFCGMFALGLVILYFLNSRIRGREKLAAALWLGVLFIGFFYEAPYLVWHAFNTPVGFPNRQAFLMVFTLLYLGRRCFARLRGGVGRRQLAMGFVVFLLAAAMAAQLGRAYISPLRLWLDVLLFAVMYLVLWLYLFPPVPLRRPWLRRRGAGLALAALLLLQTGNLLDNGREVLAQFDYEPLSDYTDFVERVEPAVRQIQAEDTGFYRMEQTFHRERNDPMLFSYRGLSHFSSTELAATKNFLGALGFRNNGNWAHYRRGSTLAADCLLGVKYRLTDAPCGPPYTKRSETDGLSVYENPLTLPLGFLTADGVTETDMGGDDPFARQNRMFTDMLGGETVLFRPAARAAEPKTEQGAVTYTLVAQSGDPLYAYFTQGELDGADVTVNGEARGEYFTQLDYGVLPLGRFAPGETVTLRLTPQKKALRFREALFYHEDTEALKRAAAALRAAPYALSSFTSSHFTGTVTAQGDKTRLLLTIPADKGWIVRVDGAAVPAEKAFGALLSVPLSPGEHEVDLRYIPPGFIPGVFISAGSILLLALWVALRRRPTAFPSPLPRRTDSWR